MKNLFKRQSPQQMAERDLQHLEAERYLQDIARLYAESRINYIDARIAQIRKILPAGEAGDQP